MLRLDQHGEESQIIADRRVRRELTQPCCAVRKNRRAIGQADARYRRSGEGFDLTGLEIRCAMAGRSWGYFLMLPVTLANVQCFCAAQSSRYFGEPLVTSRNQARWCFHAQPGVTVPRVIARIEPLIQIAA